MSHSEANKRWAEWFKSVIKFSVDEAGNAIEMRETWHLDPL
jgi:hypothetical protein